jgi:hypothetical protein
MHVCHHVYTAYMCVCMCMYVCVWCPPYIYTHRTYFSSSINTLLQSPPSLLYTLAPHPPRPFPSLPPSELVANALRLLQRLQLIQPVATAAASGNTSLPPSAAAAAASASSAASGPEFCVVDVVGLEKFVRFGVSFALFVFLSQHMYPPPHMTHMYPPPHMTSFALFVFLSQPHPLLPLLFSCILRSLSSLPGEKVPLPCIPPPPCHLSPLLQTAGAMAGGVAKATHYIYTHIHKYMNTYKITYVHTHVHTYIRTHTYADTRTHVYVCVCVIDVYMYLYIYINSLARARALSLSLSCARSLCRQIKAHHTQTRTHIPTHTHTHTPGKWQCSGPKRLVPAPLNVSLLSSPLPLPSFSKTERARERERDREYRVFLRKKPI